MIDPPLNNHIPRIQDPHLARVQSDLELSLDNKVVIDAVGAMHSPDVTRREVHHSRRGPVGDDDARRILDQMLVCCQILILIQLCGELGRGVAEGDFHPIGKSRQRGFVCKNRGEDCETVIVMGCDEAFGIAETVLCRHVSAVCLSHFLIPAILLKRAYNHI